VPGIMSDFEFEKIVCQSTSVHVFKIPPRTTAGGYRASEWTEEVWEGRLQVITKGAKLDVVLKDRNTGAEFARSPYSDSGAVEKAADSSRYFVLRCINPKTQQKAFIGLAFNERSDAFEFMAAIQDFEKQQKQEVSSSCIMN